MRAEFSSKLPGIIVGIMGTVLEVSIVVCLEEVIVDRILSFDVFKSGHPDETILKLAVIASALRTCSDTLRQEYRSMEQATSHLMRVEEETWHLPNPTAAPSLNNLILALEFEARLGRRNRKNINPDSSNNNSEVGSLFLALYDGREVVVKFTDRYYSIAHGALVAALNYAPKLHACERVLGGQIMVVMDRLDGTRMFDTVDHNHGPGLSRKVFEDLETALKILHDQDIVFGDIRSVNVMLTKSGGTNLIDFDWAAREGEGRYPPLINADLITSWLLTLSRMGSCTRNMMRMGS